MFTSSTLPTSSATVPVMHVGALQTAQVATSSLFSSTDLQGCGTLVASTTVDENLELEIAAACQRALKVVVR